MHSTPLSRLRRRLLLSSSLLMAGAAGPAWAQAFQGTPTVASGSVTFSRTTPGVETITQSSPVAVINWSPSDTGTGGGPINFLPAGTTATYRNSPTSQLTNFTTVNRVLPVDTTRQVALNGTVNSLIVGATGASATGGQVWFYSPGGILVGSTGVFNVGGLVLSADDPVISGGTPYGTNNFVSFVGGANSTATVAVSAGATITALPTGGYVVLVAPRVVQSGSVRVNGQAAYVAGEQVNVTFKTPGQLFDIAVPVGSFVPTTSTDNTVLRHDGTTTGPASTGTSDPHAIYLVADPKNAAIRTLLQVNGQFGFDTATSATVANGSIVLSDGINNGLAGGFTDSGQVHDVAITGAGTVNSTFTANIGQARNVDVSATGQSTLGFGDLSLTASNLGGGTRPTPSITINALGTGALSASGSINAFAGVNGYTQSNGTTVPGVGGTIGVTVESGASLAVSGSVNLNTSVTGGAATSTTTGGAGGAATGGSVTIASAGATSMANLSAFANATGGAGFTAASPGGTGTGGRVSLASTGGTFRVTGGTSLSASGTGGRGASGQAVGGNVQIGVVGGTASLGTVLSYANADGGSGTVGGAASAGTIGVSISGGGTTMAALSAFTNATGGTGSTGRGGNALGTSGGINLNQSGGSLTVAGQIALQNGATGGQGVGGGDAFAGSTVLALQNATLTAASLAASAFGVGGNAFGSGSGGNGTGGIVTTAIATTGAASDRITVGFANLNVQGNGGAAASGAGGVGTGGSATLSAGAGAMSLGSVNLLASSTGGVGAAGGAGGAATGGNTLAQTMGGSITTTSFNGNASATGGAGGGGGAGGAGGTATGGTAQLIGRTGALALGSSATLDSSAFAGAGGQSATGVGGAGGAGLGGTTTITSAVSFSASSLSAFANANGGAAYSAGGLAGGATAGAVNLTSTAGNFQVTGATQLNVGGMAGTGSAGQGIGGNARFTISGGTAAFGAVTLYGDGFGSNGTVGGAAGASQLSVSIAGGSTTMASLTAYNDVQGGTGSTGRGGNAVGTGTSDSVAVTGGSLAITGQALVQTSATGGQGAIGGNGAAGNAAVTVGNGTLSAGSLFVYAFGGGGAASGSGGGGNGTGGSASVAIALNGTANDRITAGQTTLLGYGNGGSGVTGAGGAGVGGSASITAGAGAVSLGATTVTATGGGGLGGGGFAGGTATGGTSLVQTVGGTITTANYSGSASASGGAGGAGAAGGDATGGTARAATQTGALRLGSNFSLDGSAAGGAGGQSATGAGGAGGGAQGGTSSAIGGGGAIVSGTTSTISAVATGGVGGAGFANAGAGGNATGGVVTVQGPATGGSMTLAGLSLDVSATAGVGAASTGIGTGGAGGTAAGGDASLIASGAISATNARINANATGGGGGAGGSTTQATGTRAGGAGGAATGGLAYVGSLGGLLRLSGTQLQITADATAGAGGNGGAGGAGGSVGGAGGLATGGTGSAADNFRRGAYLIGQGGSIDFTGLASATGAARAALVEAVAYGGAGGTGGVNGSAGGAGGNGNGGVAQAMSQGAAVVGDRLSIFADAYGGAGGAGFSGGGGNGGAGGVARGGLGLVSAEKSANAVLTLNSTLIGFADGFGGAGGAGGSSATRGGTGGAGGDGTTGITQVQALKGRLTVGMFNLTAAQNAGGGAGGAGGNATATGGVGGAGGNGGNGVFTLMALLADGGTATVGDTRLWAYSQGGNGGVGGTGTMAGLAGIGGNGAGGELRAEAGVSTIDGTAGSLSVGNLIYQFDISGGTGATAGTVSGGVANAYALSAPATFASITTTTTSTGGATLPLPGATVGGATINLVADSASLAVTGSALLRASGLTTLRASNGGSLNTGSVRILSGSALLDQTGGVFASPFVTGSLDAQVTGNFTATATAPIKSTGAVNVSAGGAISVSNVTSASDDINLAAMGNIAAGALSAGDTISLQTSGGGVTSGSLAAGLVVTGAEDYIGGVGIDAARAVATGSISARGGVLVASRTAGVSTGAIASGDDALLVAATTISAGSITVLPTTGTVDFAADGANVLLGGVATLPAFGSTFTSAGVAALRASLNPTSGSITAGDISASGALAASAGTTLTLGNLSNFAQIDLMSVGDTRIGGFAAGTSAGRLGIVSGGAVTIAGDVLGAGVVDVAAQRNVSVANIVSPSGTSIRLGANGSITGRALTAQTVKVASGGTVSLGAVTSTAAPDGSYRSRLAILARNGLSLTSATSNTNLELYSVNGSISAGSLTAPDSLIALSGGSITTTSIASGAPYLAGIATVRDKAFGSSVDPATITDFRAIDPNLYLPNSDTSPASAAANLYTITPVAAPGSISAGTVQGKTIVASSATSIDLTAAGSFAPQLVTAPSVSLTINGDFTLPAGIQARDSLSINGTGSVTTGALTVGSSIDIEAVNAIKVGAVTMQATGGSLNLVSSNGGVATGDVRNADVYIQAQGDVTFASLLTDTNSEANIYTNGAVTGGDVRAAEIEIGAAKTVTLGNVSTNTAPDVSGAHTDGLAVLGVGDVKIASVFSRNRAELYSVNGTLDVGTINASELIVALAGNAIRIGTATTPGVAYLAGFATTTTSSGRSVFLDYGSYVDADLAGRGDVNLFNPSGSFTANSAALANVTPSTTAGAIGVGALTAGSVVAASGTSVTLAAPGALVARNVSAPTVALTAAGLLSITGSVTGGALSLASSDIAIDAKATLGGATTKTLALVANNAAVRLGGTTQGSGYTLDAAEALTVSAGSVSIAAPGTGQGTPTVTIDSINTQGSLANGGTSAISIQTPGDVNVVGKVEMVGAAATDTLAINAGGTLRLTTPGAGIRLSGATTATGVGPLAGTLRLSAATVLVASDAAAADIAKATTIDARAARLAQNDGPTDAAGYLQANAITLAASRAIYVQNSGTATQPAGLTAGPGGLTLTPLAVTEQGTSRPEVILYGRQQTTSGSFITGGALIPATMVTGGATALATGSSINGCLISSGGNCGTPAPTPMTPEVPMAIANIADVVSAVVQATTGSSTKSTLSPPTITTAFLLDFTPLTSFADIDKPVTGIGNDDLLPDDFGRPAVNRPRADRPARVPPAAASPAPSKTGSVTPK